MGYALRLVERVRRETGNNDYSWGYYGLGQRHFLDKLNDAQDRLQSLIVPIDPHYFETTQIITPVAGTNAYSLNGQCFLGDYETFVEFSDSGQADDYKIIPAISLTDFNYDRDDDISGYLMRDGQIILSPTPSSTVGRIRVTYIKEFYDLATRVGQIASNNATTITLAAAPVPLTETVLDEAGNFDADYLCVVDSAGLVLNSAIVTTGYNTGTRVFTAAVGAGVTLTVGAWVVIGQYASSHTEGPRNWDRYLIEYAKRAILAGEEGSIDFANEDPTLQKIENDIMEAAMSAKCKMSRPVLLSRYYR